MNLAGNTETVFVVRIHSVRTFVTIVGLVAAAVSVSVTVGGCRAVDVVARVCLVPAVATDVAIAVEPAML